jgi:hypothetical protein
MRSVILALLLVLRLVVACKSNDREHASQPQPGSAPATQPQPVVAKLVDLSSSLDPLRSELAAHPHEAIFLTLLSPT